MLKRSLVVLGLVGCMSAFASAQVSIEYWPTDEAPNGTNDKFEMDNSGGDVTRRLYIGLSGGDGSLFMGGMDFVFDWPTGVEMTNFEWRITPLPPADPLDPPGLPLGPWSGDSSLPAPALSTFADPIFNLNQFAVVPTGPDPQVLVAEVDLTVAASVANGNYSIGVASADDAAGPTVVNQFFELYDVDQGSSSIPFNVTPEPATMVLLALGGFTALRRRRS